MVERTVRQFGARPKSDKCANCRFKLGAESFGVDMSKGFGGSVESLGWFCTWSCYADYRKKREEEQKARFIEQDVFD